MFGITNLSLVPVRTEPSDRSELCTQLLFGDAYTVLEESENAKWIKIRSIFDAYEGWIDLKQHHSVNEAHFNAYIMTEHPINYDDVALVENAENHFLILLGSTLPFLKERELTLGSKQYHFSGEILYTPKDIDAKLIRFLAFRFLHAPYLWGGKTIFGIDCSGFVQQVYKLLGYKLSRDAYQQADHGTAVNQVKETQTGDLAFFHNEAGKIIHVGILLEENRIIHAHGKVRIDLLDEKGIFNLTTKKYSHNLSKIKRIIA